MVTRLPIIDVPDHACERCLLRKQHRNSFSIEKSRRVKQPSKLVYINISYPDEVRSLGHNKYIVTFIDDFPRKTWIYLLK